MSDNNTSGDSRPEHFCRWFKNTVYGRQDRCWWCCHALPAPSTPAPADSAPRKA